MQIISKLLNEVLKSQTKTGDPVLSYEQTDWFNIHQTHKETSKGQYTKIAIADYKIDFDNAYFSGLSGHEEFDCITNKSVVNPNNQEKNPSILDHGTLMATLISGSEVDLNPNTPKYKYTGPLPNTHIVNMIIGDNSNSVDISSVGNALLRTLNYNQENPNAKIDIILIPYVENPTQDQTNLTTTMKHAETLYEKDLIGYSKIYDDYVYIKNLLNLLDSTGVTIICASGNYYTHNVFGFTPPACFSSSFTIGAARYSDDGKLMLHEKTNRSQKKHKNNEYPCFISALAPVVQKKVDNLKANRIDLELLINSSSVASAMFTGFLGAFRSYQNKNRVQFSNQELRNLLDKVPNKTNPGRYKVVKILNFFTINI